MQSFLKASEGLRDQDPDLEAMRLLFAAWHELYGNAPKTTAEVVAAGGESAPMTSSYNNPDLRDALYLVCSEKPNPRRLGQWLSNHRDRIVDGLTLKKAGCDTHTKIARWSVQSAGDAPQTVDDGIPL